MHTGVGKRAAALVATLIAAFAFASAGAAAAEGEVRRVEAVGIYGIRDAMRTKVIPRDEAIADARWEGVSRVALELIGESALAYGDDLADGPGAGDRTFAPSRGIEAPLEAQRDARARGARVDPDDVRLDRMAPTDDQAALLETVLGQDMLPYTRGFRILEDQGELPVLFADAPGVDTEYVVVVEVVVDVGRVETALEDAGLVAASGAAPDEALTLELVGLSRYEALEQVVAALRGPLGATRVATLEFERERQLLAVEGPFDAEVLATLVADLSDPRLVLEPIDLDPVYGRLRVLARWFPALEGEPASKTPPVSSRRR